MERSKAGLESVGEMSGKGMEKRGLKEEKKGVLWKKEEGLVMGEIRKQGKRK